MKKVLITGAAGQLGNDLVAAFNKNFNVIAADRKTLDFTNKVQTNSIISNEKPNLIIHSGAWTNVDGCAEDPQKALLVNGEGTRNIANSAKKIGCRLVYVSTNEVFDGKKKTSYNEKDKVSPLTSYGKSKYVGEIFAQEILNEDCIIIRTSWLYGPSGKSNFPIKIIAAADKFGELKVVDDEISTPTYTPHLAKAIKDLATKKTFGIFNLINEGSCSRYEWAAEILKLSGRVAVPLRPIKLADFERKSKPPAFCPLVNVRAKELGIVLPIWQEGTKDFFKKKSELLSN